ncbi:hypothetical protein C1H46_038929 [Malus baccata]|uniref:Helicase C-terminal domain-containing protein n=1 Tax=Malus baccata TaxID=106549 RepID=A0A540KMU3_MALBA|nr:hypothetical protein C1H46_038929 [Malus baccata]
MCSRQFATGMVYYFNPYIKLPFQRFSGNGLRSAIAFEAEKGYRNALGRKMRFSNFLFSTVSRLCSRSKHSLAKNILEEVGSYGIASISDRSKLLNKVSVLVGYDSLDDLVENERAERQSGMHVRDVTDEFDVSLVCARFPSIMLGSSPRVELYDGTTSFSERMLFPTQSCEEFPSDAMCEEQSATVVTEENSHQTVPVEESSNKVLLKSQNDTGSVQFSLDSSISFIPGISKKRCQQLEDSGFHTLRQLLHHFPRTYADLQNAQMKIDDGQYLIFIGKVLSSRGIKASSSFSFIEVVVGCEIMDDESTEHMNDSADSRRKKTISLHLKKFFRGARFTSLPFLRLVEGKHKEGDFVCVSGKAYKGIHEPKSMDEADLARKRLIFDEFFYLQLARLYQMLEGLGTQIEKDGLLDKYRKPVSSAAYMKDWSILTKKFSKALPYTLTPSQLTAISEIIWDLRQPVPMNRLLQGDVGCGKTVVAFLACMEVIGSGYQGLRTGEISMVIGTTSLISDKIEFSALRIAVVDEQHRFGVIQRGRLNNVTSKGDNHMAPHVLAMSATPIPRTLALALYGDMSLTQITDLPPGRIPVETFIIEGNDNGFEDVYEGYTCGLLHGRMKSDEKDEALRKFRSGETNILLSTQVIEIGVDVPDASMMVVMNAERFGIAQLHQLRGRVGRGVRKSKCILLASSSSSLTRLKVLGKSSDGFYLANMDLLLRGPGNLFGKKQSGHLPEFPIARLEVDGNILQEAHLAGLKVLGASHDLEQFPILKAELSMREPLSILGD